ncbi:MAG: hypothetical protein JWO89_3149 [Verrucomicrobiaceae bacterium]|nr:hypothetical protein [Verrucomicrobiaceae bacterium]
MPIRPPTLGICGIIMILFGTMALMNLITAGMGQGIASQPAVSTNPVTVAMQDSVGLKMFHKLLIVPIFLTGVLGVVAGIGVLKGRNGARKAGILWAILYLVIGLAENGATIHYLRQIVATMPMPPTVKPDMVEVARSQIMISSFINAGFTTVFFLALAVAMIVLLTRPAVVKFCTAKPFD